MSKFPPFVFGSGINGYDSAVSTAYEITQTQYYSSFVIDNSSITSGIVPLFARELIHVKNGSVITASGNSGFATGLGLGKKIFASDGNGGAPSASNSNPGTSPTSEACFGGAGGDGGQDSLANPGGLGASAPYTPGPFGARSSSLSRRIFDLVFSSIETGTPVFEFIGGGGGGGSGYGNPGGGGGRGGGGGGIVWLCADTIVLEDDCIISTYGGGGGSASNVDTGGGGGGGGGAVVFVCNHFVRETPTSGSIDCLGGAGGNGNGGGTAGADGDPGSIYIITPSKARVFPSGWAGTKV